MLPGAHAVEAVEAVVMMLEDSKYFNAGRGSVFTNAGTHEMDASIMDGTTGTAGAVCNVQNVRNPIQLARAVARGTQHVMLCGAGAERCRLLSSLVLRCPMLTSRAMVPVWPRITECRSRTTTTSSQRR
eukprot:970930-Rhodomonas_salina.2